MFGLFHFLCIVTCVAASKQIYGMCPGTSFYIPRSLAYDPEMSDLYFTPQSPSAKAVMVLNKTQPTDDHYKFKDQTLFISELRETDTGIFSWGVDVNFHTVLKLVIKDCTMPQVVGFGQPLKLKVPHEASILEFVHPSSPNRGEVLWNTSSSSDDVSKGVIQESYWMVRAATTADMGSYTFRKQSGAEVSKTQVTITANVQAFNMDEELYGSGIWETNLQIPDHEISVVFSPQPGEEYRIVSGGTQTDEGKRLFEDRIRLPGSPNAFILELDDLQRSDAGRYQFFDKDGILVALRILRTYQQTYYMYLLALIPVVLLILLGVCVWKCCCNKGKAAPPLPQQLRLASAMQPYSGIEMSQSEPTNETGAHHPSDTIPEETIPSAPSPPSSVESSPDPQPQFQFNNMGDFFKDFTDFTNFTTSFSTSTTNTTTTVFSSCTRNQSGPTFQHWTSNNEDMSDRCETS